MNDKTMSSVDVESKTSDIESTMSCVCVMCGTVECSLLWSTSSSSSVSSVMSLSGIPSELLTTIMSSMSLKDLSNLSITNNWFRDFVCNYFFRSKNSLKSLLGRHSSAVNAIAIEDREARVETFTQLGLLFKRMTCLFPTTQRIQLLMEVFERIDGIPVQSCVPEDNHTIRFVFQCYGKVIHKLISGWDECEVDYVFQVFSGIRSEDNWMQTMTNPCLIVVFSETTRSEQLVQSIANRSYGVRQPIEYFLRSFYRKVFIDSSDRRLDSTETRVWIKRILKPFELKTRAQLLVIIFGPLIAVDQTPTTFPYIGWWALTDTFFIDEGLEELGFALFAIQDNTQDIEYVISLLELMIKMPENWLMENVATLLFYAGDHITYHYLMAKICSGDYSDCAQKVVYLTLINHKIDKNTEKVFKLIERLCVEKHKNNFLNELPIAFEEAIHDIDGAIELEEERDVTEMFDIIAANNDLMKNFAIKCFANNKDSDFSDSTIDSIEE